MPSNRYRRVQAQRKFAAGAYIPPAAPLNAVAERRNDPVPAREEHRNIFYNNMSADDLLDIIAFQHLQKKKQPVVILERIIPTTPDTPPAAQAEADARADAGAAPQFRRIASPTSEQTDEDDRPLQVIAQKLRRQSPRRVRKRKTITAVRTRGRPRTRSTPGHITPLPRSPLRRSARRQAVPANIAMAANKPGRPAKAGIPADIAAVNKPGRPTKAPIPADVLAVNNPGLPSKAAIAADVVAVNKPGRPSKAAIPADILVAVDKPGQTTASAADNDGAVNKPGRPTKAPIPAAFDDDNDSNWSNDSGPIVAYNADFDTDSSNDAEPSVGRKKTAKKYTHSTAARQSGAGTMVTRGAARRMDKPTPKPPIKIKRLDSCHSLLVPYKRGSKQSIALEELKRARRRQPAKQKRSPKAGPSTPITRKSAVNSDDFGPSPSKPKYGTSGRVTPSVRAMRSAKLYRASASNSADGSNINKTNQGQKRLEVWLKKLDADDRIQFKIPRVPLRRADEKRTKPETAPACAPAPTSVPASAPPTAPTNAPESPEPQEMTVPAEPSPPPAPASMSTIAPTCRPALSPIETTILEPSSTPRTISPALNSIIPTYTTDLGVDVNSDYLVTAEVEYLESESGDPTEIPEQLSPFEPALQYSDEAEETDYAIGKYQDTVALMHEDVDEEEDDDEGDDEGDDDVVGVGSKIRVTREDFDELAALKENEANSTRRKPPKLLPNPFAPRFQEGADGRWIAPATMRELKQFEEVNMPKNLTQNGRPGPSSEAGDAEEDECICRPRPTMRAILAWKERQLGGRSAGCAGCRRLERVGHLGRLMLQQRALGAADKGALAPRPAPTPTDNPALADAAAPALGASPKTATTTGPGTTAAHETSPKYLDVFPNHKNLMVELTPISTSGKAMMRAKLMPKKDDNATSEMSLIEQNNLFEQLFTHWMNGVLERGDIQVVAGENGTEGSVSGSSENAEQSAGSDIRESADTVNTQSSGSVDGTDNAGTTEPDSNSEPAENLDTGTLVERAPVRAENGRNGKPKRRQSSAAMKKSKAMEPTVDVRKEGVAECRTGAESRKAAAAHGASREQPAQNVKEPPQDEVDDWAVPASQPVVMLPRIDTSFTLTPALVDPATLIAHWTTEDTSPAQPLHAPMPHGHDATVPPSEKHPTPAEPVAATPYAITPMKVSIGCNTDHYPEQNPLIETLKMDIKYSQEETIIIESDESQPAQEDARPPQGPAQQAGHEKKKAAPQKRSLRPAEQRTAVREDDEPPVTKRIATRSVAEASNAQSQPGHCDAASQSKKKQRKTRDPPLPRKSARGPTPSDKKTNGPSGKRPDGPPTRRLNGPTSRRPSGTPAKKVPKRGVVGPANQVPRPRSMHFKIFNDCFRTAPVFHPTAEEFKDPLAYIVSIMPKALEFGLCKVVSPFKFEPSSMPADDERFSVVNQYLARLFCRWGPASREMCAIKAYLAEQKVFFTRPPLIDGIELNLPKLYRIVQRHGGLKKVIEKKRWGRVAEEMRFPRGPRSAQRIDLLYVKHLLPYDTLLSEERKALLEKVERTWNRNYARMVRRAANPLRRQRRLLNESPSDEDSSDAEAGEEEDANLAVALAEAEDCVVSGRNMKLSVFRKIAENLKCNLFTQRHPNTQDVEEKYWDLVGSAAEHVCVNAASIDTGDDGYGVKRTAEQDAKEAPWTLKQLLSRSRDNCLRTLGPVLGVTVPTLHLGMVLSTSCWHRDPHGLPWVEFMHKGPAKIWYGIPDSNSARFRAAVEQLCPTACQNKKIWLPSDITMIPPPMLAERGVPLARTVQRPGEFVIVLPRAYSSSISTGYTETESVYFATQPWLKDVASVSQELRDSCEPTTFSLDQLLLSVAMGGTSHLGELAAVQYTLADIVAKEMDARRKLLQWGVHFDHNEKPDSAVTSALKNRPAGAWNVRDQDECEVCRTTLYMSKVTGLSDKRTSYCTEHACLVLERRAALRPGESNVADGALGFIFVSHVELEAAISRIAKRLGRQPLLPADVYAWIN